MREAYTVAAIRAGEEAAFAWTAEGELMDRAATGLATVIADRLARRRPEGTRGARVVLLAGPGNNGGDGLYAAAQLAAAGATAQFWLADARAHPGGLAALVEAGGTPVGGPDALEEALGRADVVVDALLGIGGHAGLRGAMAQAAASVAAARAGRPGAAPLVVAVDTPSGLAVDPPFAPLAGDDAAPHVTADVTVTFGGLKLCHVLEPGRAACGEVVPIDIGLTGLAPALRAWERADVAAAWPVPTAGDDKYARGVVGVDTGSARYPGAAVLSVLGALYGGAGFVRYAGDDAARAPLLVRAPSLTYGSGRVQAWVLGCGWDDQAFNHGRLAARLADGVPCVLDATVLDLLPGWDEPLPPGCLLTPHAGELARLLGTERAAVVADPLASARAAADRFGAAVLLKGATQVVASPGEPVVDLAVPGPAWTAQAGSGDVLAGLAGTLLAAGLPAAEAAVLAASLQAMAASRHPGPYPPDALARRLPRVIARLVRPQA